MNHELYKILKKHKEICQRCGVKVKTKKNARHYDPNFGTIQHIYPKNDLRRNLIGQWDCITLFCYKCNQEDNNLNIENINFNYNILNLYTKERPNVLLDLLNGDITWEFKP